MKCVVVYDEKIRNEKKGRKGGAGKRRIKKT
jgi:hypothetical protein